MDNQNTPEYLSKCREVIIENLRHVEGAPGVQMQRALILCVCVDFVCARLLSVYVCVCEGVHLAHLLRLLCLVALTANLSRRLQR
jgi:hypothetical protein